MALLTGLMVAIGGAIGDSMGAMIMLVIAIGMNFLAIGSAIRLFLKVTMPAKFLIKTRRNFTALLRSWRKMQSCQCRVFM